MALTDEALKIGQGYGSALSGISNMATSVGNVTNKITSLISKGSTANHIRDLYTNGFLAKDSVFNPNFFARAFDEPTYLTFRIEFITDDYERNIAYNNRGVVDDAYTNAYYSQMYDYMPEPFLQEYGDVGGDSSFGRMYSTEAYLDLNLGDHGRASLLHNFKLALKDIEKNFPFYFKSVSGLQSLSTVDPKNGARLKNAELTIECEEGLDLKITQLINMYRKIVWDDVYQRWILPDMMRYFGFRIYISEIRMFHEIRQTNSTGVNLDVFGNNQKPKAYDFNNKDTRNATTLPMDKSKWWETANNAVTTGTAVSAAFLGTQSYITQTMEYTKATAATAMDVANALNNMFNDLSICNSALNEVMPTLCFECHMCEFNIENSLEYLGTMHNNTHDSKKVNPQIRIKVGQVKEKQSYPLNKTLRMNKDATGYFNTVKEYSKNSTIGIGDNPSAKDISDLRDSHNFDYTGQFVSDDILNKRRYKSAKMNERLQQYSSDLAHYMGDTPGLSLGRRRLNPKLIDALDNKIGQGGELDYSLEASPEELAWASLGATALNEAVSNIRKYGGEGVTDWVGSDSVATHPSDSTEEAINTIGAALEEAAEKIYQGEELRSLAISDTLKAQIADTLYNEYLNNVEEWASTATTDSILLEFLRNYKVIRRNTPIPIQPIPRTPFVPGQNSLNR